MFAAYQGGAIFATGFNLLRIDTGTEFINNYAFEAGDDIYIRNAV